MTGKRETPYQRRCLRLRVDSRSPQVPYREARRLASLWSRLEAADTPVRRTPRDVAVVLAYVDTVQRLNTSRRRFEQRRRGDDRLRRQMAGELLEHHEALLQRQRDAREAEALLERPVRAYHSLAEWRLAHAV